MAMRKRLFWAAALCLCLIWSLNAAPAPAADYSAEKPMLLKCGVPTPPGDMESKTIKYFGDLVTERTKGRVTFKYFYSSSLIKKPQFVDAVARGIADISSGPASFVTGKIPDLSIFEIYGNWALDKYFEQAEAVEPALQELFAKHNIRILYQFYSGQAVFCHKSKFLKTPADWQGQKMRVPGRWLSTLAGQWGASPVFMAPPELYLAAQRGVIDGFMLIYDIVNGLKLHEVTPYITDTQFTPNISVQTMNLDKWNMLTDEDKKIFIDTAKEVMPWNYEKTLEHYENLKKAILAAGGKIYVLTPEEKSAYLKDAHALYPEVAKASGPIGKKFMELLEPYRDR